MDAAAPHGTPYMGMNRRAPLALRIIFVLLGAIVAAGAANVLVGLGGATVESFIRGWGASLVYVVAAVIIVARAVCVADRRAAWIVLAAGMTFYAAGNVVWAVFYDGLAAPPIPSISDGLWLALYPASYVGLLLLARADRAVAGGVWLDGIIAGLGFAALGAAVVFGPVLSSATGSVGAVMTNLAYPIADLLLVSLVLGLMVLRGWRMDRCWALLGTGFALLYVADSAYLLRVAAGDPQVSLVPNVFYLAGVVVLARAAWAPTRGVGAAQVDNWAVLIVPAAFVATAVGLLAYDHFGRVDLLAIVLAVATLLAAFVRTALAFRDVRSLAQTRREALTDDLTSLPNRRMFLRTAEQLIDGSRAARDGVGLLIIDLDQFKKLNDTLGHHAGDSLLCQIGPRLAAVVREGDLLARLGGDEFGVLLPAPCGESVALGIADEIVHAFHDPFEIEGLALHVAASIGIALSGAHARDAQQLLRKADIAMYEAKVNRSGRELYTPDCDTNTRDSLALACELPNAIATDELEVYFQPKADSVSGRVVGMEALVRWRHPQRGMLAPGEFVALADQAGLMRDLTRSVIAGALTACRGWHDAGHVVHVAVNVTFTDLMDADFPLEVAAALAQHGVDPGMLILELTESSIMSDAQRAGDGLARLSEFGVMISLDDFGTGYSSLTHLGSLPVNEVKIDRGFVAAIRTDATADAIVRSTIALAHNLGMRAVAEGVEDAETWAALAELDCEFIQGYHLSRPLPFADVMAFLDANRDAPTAPGARSAVADGPTAARVPRPRPAPR